MLNLSYRQLVTLAGVAFLGIFLVQGAAQTTPEPSSANSQPLKSISAMDPSRVAAPSSNSPEQISIQQPLTPGSSVDAGLAGPVLPEMVPNATGDGVHVARAIESFSDLTLKGSELKAVEPLLGSREVTPDFIRELWQVRWRPNDPIDLWVIRPRGVKRAPVVLYLYGFPTETDRFKNAAYCKRLVENGAAAVGFVSALTGHRTEFRPMSENFISRMPEALASSVHDITMILDTLQTRADLDVTNVGIFAQGSGAAIAILSASIEPRIHALDLLDPWGDWPQWFAATSLLPKEQRADYLKPEFQKTLEPLEPLRILPQLKTQKVRLIFTGDGAPAKNVMEKILATAPASIRVSRVPTLRALYADRSDEGLFKWINAQVGARPSTVDNQKQPATTDMKIDPKTLRQAASTPSQTATHGPITQ